MGVIQESGPDPNRVQYTVLKTPDVDIFTMMQTHEVPCITHSALWMLNLKDGSARPFSISFQGQYLESFLYMIAE